MVPSCAAGHIPNFSVPDSPWLPMGPELCRRLPSGDLDRSPIDTPPSRHGARNPNNVARRAQKRKKKKGIREAPFTPWQTLSNPNLKAWLIDYL